MGAYSANGHNIAITVSYHKSMCFVHALDCGVDVFHCLNDLVGCSPPRVIDFLFASTKYLAYHIAGRVNQDALGSVIEKSSTISSGF